MSVFARRRPPQHKKLALNRSTSVEGGRWPCLAVRGYRRRRNQSRRRLPVDEALVLDAGRACSRGRCRRNSAVTPRATCMRAREIAPATGPKRSRKESPESSPTLGQRLRSCLRPQRAALRSGRRRGAPAAPRRMGTDETTIVDLKTSERSQGRRRHGVATPRVCRWARGSDGADSRFRRGLRGRQAEASGGGRRVRR